MVSRWITIAGAMVAVVLAASSARADFLYSLQFEDQDVEINKITLHFDAAEIVFTTSTILTEPEPQIIPVDPAQDLNGLSVQSIQFSRSGIVPDLPHYDFIAPEPDLSVSFGSVAGFLASVDNADHVGTYHSDLFARGILFDAGGGALVISFYEQSGTLVISEVAAVPNPSVLVLFGTGAIVVLVSTRRRRRRSGG